jgi:2-keto-3-deoxy-galactonokinase
MPTLVCDNSHHRIGDDALPVVAQRVPHESQLAGILALAIQPRIRFVGGMERCIAGLLTTEVVRFTARIAKTVINLARCGLANKTLVTSPGLDARAIYAEVFREQVILIGNGHHFVEEGDDDIVSNPGAHGSW